VSERVSALARAHEQDYLTEDPRRIFFCNQPSPYQGYLDTVQEDRGDLADEIYSPAQETRAGEATGSCHKFSD